MFSLQSCTVNDNAPVVDHDTISTTFENASPYSFTPNNNFSVKFNFPNPIYASDMVLVYRLSEIYQGQDVWKLLPETHYFSNGSRDFGYDYDFTKYDVKIYLLGNDLVSVPSGNRLGQYFRIVVVPADLVKAVNVNKYDELVKALNIKENEIQQIQF